MPATEPPWASKRGGGDLPGYSQTPAPSFASEFGPVICGAGGDLCVLIDAERFVYGISNRTIAYKIDDEGTYQWKFQTTEKLGLFAGAGVLLIESFVLYSQNGWAISLDSSNGRERWSKQFAGGGCAVELSAMVVGGENLVVSGKDENDRQLPVNRDIFCLDPHTGNTKWKFKMKLGLLNCVPQILADLDLLFLQSINGEVACLRLADGLQKWVSPQTGQQSTGGLVACRETGLLYSTANLKGKREWNRPSGGKGCLRAFRIETGELLGKYEEPLECNAPPIVAPVGPDGQLLLIYGLGANPGTWKEPLGDDWPARVVARDARTSDYVWWSDHREWRGHGPGGTDASDRHRSVQTICWSSATASADGRVFIGWHGCACLELDGKTGRTVAQLTDQSFFPSAPALGPDLLAVAGRHWLYIFPGHRIRGAEVRPLQIPLKDSGCQHFWPHKMQNLQHTEFSELPAISDISGEASHVAVDFTKHPFRIPGIDFYHKTPVVDSQRNVYLATNGSRTLVVRPDGTIRATIPTGMQAGNLCLHDRYLYAVNGPGYLLKVDIETLEVVLNKKYTDYTSSDSWNPCVCEKQEILLTIGNLNLTIQGPVGGNYIIFGLRITDAAVVWFYLLSYFCYNFLPSVMEDRDSFVFSDAAGGLYCLRISDGAELWKDLTIPENAGAFTTGHCSSGPNGIVYNAYNLKAPPGAPLGVWNRGMGGGGAVRACVIETGERKWLRTFDLECHVAPVVVPKAGASSGYVVVVPQGSQGGFVPPEEGELDDDSTAWPTGDAWESRFVGLDAETGEEIWRLEVPTYFRYEARGGSYGDIFLPDCFGSPTASANGNVYCIHWSGVAYCIEGTTGKLVSQKDVQSSSQSAPIIFPGTLVLPTALNLYFFNSRALEQSWLEVARAVGDPRADPRLWEWSEQGLTERDRQALDLSLNASPDRGAFPEFEYRPISAPVPTVRAAFDARLRRILQTFQGEAVPASAPEPMSGDGDESPELLWEVVGGSKAGGITVREDQSLKSAELGQLSKGARVKQLGLEGQRLHYALVPGTGAGPEQGWVSISLKGTELVKRL